MTKNNYCLHQLLVLSLLVFSFISKSNATSISELINQSKLAITVHANQNEVYVVGQPIVVSIEVATDRWFAKGTRIDEFQQQGVVVLPFEQLAINGTKSVNGNTWVTQTREFTVFPMVEGTLQLPQIELFISANVENNLIIEGWVKVDIPVFQIAIPNELSSIETYIVSPMLTLSVDGNTNTEEELSQGDAFTQTYTLKAENLPAMMLPELKIIEQLGVSIYRKPAQVFDIKNRGALTGTRVESITYIFEKTGSYTIPEQIIYWWHPINNNLNEIVIPERKWTVGGSAVKADINSFSLFNIKPFMFFYLFTVVIIIVLLTLLYRNKIIIIGLYLKLTHATERQLKQQFIKAVKQHEYYLATQHLYSFHCLSNDKVTQLRSIYQKNQQQLSLLNRLFSLAYNKDIIQSHTEFSSQEIEQFFDLRSTKRKSETKFSTDKTINLNKSKN